MIENIISENIDDRSLAKAAGFLARGGIVAFPTDSTWSLAASIDSEQGVEKLKRLGERGSTAPLTVMCSEIGQVSELCELGNASFRLIKRLVPGPYVFILPSTKRAAKGFNLRRGELGVRIPNNPVPLRLISYIGKPLLSVTAKRSMLPQWVGEAEFPEEALFSAGWEIEDIPGVDIVLDPGEDRDRCRSTVLDLRGDTLSVIREGVGPLP